MDWKKALPFVAALATGGVPALVTAAAAAVSEKLGVPVEPRADSIDAALQNATPDQILAIKQVEADLKVKLREAHNESKRIDVDLTKSYISDTDAARRAHATNQGVLRLGYVINGLSYVVVAGVLYGSYQVLLNGSKLSIDPGLAAAVGSVVGGIVQWVISNSLQANGFFFGSSPGSRQASADMGAAVSNAVGHSARR